MINNLFNDTVFLNIFSKRHEKLFDYFNELDHKYGCGIEYLFLKTIELLPSINSHNKTRDINIIVMRLGLNNKIYTLQEIGDNFQLGRERVRQIVARSMRRIKRLMERELEDIKNESN